MPPSNQTIQIDELSRHCPACDTAIVGEWDPVLRRFYCPVCSAMWRGYHDWFPTRWLRQCRETSVPLAERRSR